MPRTSKPKPLAELPLHIRKHNKRWYRDTKNDKWIPADQITKYLPVPVPNHEDIIEKRYDLRSGI